MRCGVLPFIGPKQNYTYRNKQNICARFNAKTCYSGLPRYKAFHDITGVFEFLTELGEGNYVVKANGLMGGKGVKVAGDHLASIAEAITFCKEILAHGQTCVIEEKLIGQEFSFMCFCDGEHIVPMPLVQDHKRAFVDDKGPNTNGMGSYSDANHRLPFLTQADVSDAWKINQAVYYALLNEVKDKYIGILYGSFIATKNGVYVIEFNARFGDPEALSVLTILESDFAALCQAMVMGNLSDEHAKFSHLATVCKYAVPKGYPDVMQLEAVPIEICAVKNKACLYLASVKVVEGKIYATDARTAAYVGVADSISSAEEIAEKEIRAIVGPLFHREDIGTDRLIQQRIDEMRHLRE